MAGSVPSPGRFNRLLRLLVSPLLNIPNSSRWHLLEACIIRHYRYTRAEKAKQAESDVGMDDQQHDEGVIRALVETANLLDAEQ